MPRTTTAVHRFEYWVTFATIMGAEAAESSLPSYLALPAKSPGKTLGRQPSASAAPRAIEST
jgi:hypothetical protein